MYFVSAYGDIYSKYKKGLLKHYIDKDGYHRVDIHGKHIKVHKLVFETWVGEIKDGYQINHTDDDKNNNYYANLYLGTQKQNVKDCFDNNHRVGNKKKVTVYDKTTGETITFPTAKALIAYSGHSAVNGCFNRCSSRKWFKERFDIINIEGVTTIENTDMNPEVSRVVRILSPHEAQGARFTC